jgi:uncharacterized phosphosugar-binding protein
MTKIVVMSLHDGSVAGDLLPAVAPVNAGHARQAWRQHITRLLDEALERNDTVLDEVATAMATAIGSGHDVYAFGAGHSISLVMEMHRRAGGLKVVRPIWNDELTSRSDADAARRLESASGYYVLDNAGRFGDASLDIPGLDEPMAPTSAIVGAALIHAAWAGAGERLVMAGHVPEVWGSVNRGPAATSSSS